MKRYVGTISQVYFCSPKHFRTSAPIAREDDIHLPKSSRGEGGGDKYNLNRHFGNNGDGAELRERRGTAHHPLTATGHPRPRPIRMDNMTSSQGRPSCHVLELPPRRLVLLLWQSVEQPEDGGNDSRHDKNDHDRGGGGRWRRRRWRRRNGRKKMKGKNEGSRLDNDCFEQC
jgi:hypothetical protein